MKRLFCAVSRIVLPLVLVVLVSTSSGLVGTASAVVTVHCSGSSYSACIQAGYTAHGFENNYNDRHWGAVAGHNCTNYAAYMASRNGAPTPNYQLGDAVQWAGNAQAHGVPVNGNPAVGAIAYWNAGQGVGSDGHVAYVEAVTSNSVTISEDNYPSGPFRWRTISTGDALWPDAFIHFHDLPSGASGFNTAFQANTGSLITVGTTGGTNWQQGMAAGTSPSIAAVAGGYEMAFQANTGSLITVGAAGNVNWQQGMAAGTSPSIAALAGGGYVVAFQANTGSLITVGTAGGINWQQGMAPGTSPSITALAGGGFEVAFQANTGSLITVGTAGGTNWQQGMAAGTSPSVAALAGGGFEVAFQANTGSLITVGTAGGTNWQQGMASGTNPAIA